VWTVAFEGDSYTVTIMSGGLTTTAFGDQLPTRLKSDYVSHLSFLSLNLHPIEQQFE
jgi:hypothetical protein